RNPKAAANAARHYLSTLDPAVTLQQVKIVDGLTVTPYTKKHGLGTMDPAKMKATYEFVKKYGGAKQLPPLSDVYSTDYLPSSPIRP
ncbi:MAG: hypothetical protein ACRDQA_30185, partial [Nocardioidaceae bacterium]